MESVYVSAYAPKTWFFWNLAPQIIVQSECVCVCVAASVFSSTARHSLSKCRRAEVPRLHEKTTKCLFYIFPLHFLLSISSPLGKQTLHFLGIVFFPVGYLHLSPPQSQHNIYMELSSLNKFASHLELYLNSWMLNVCLLMLNLMFDVGGLILLKLS